MTVVARVRRGRRRADASEAIARLDGPIEVDYLRQGGILPAVLRRLAARLTADRDARDGTKPPGTRGLR